MTEGDSRRRAISVIMNDEMPVGLKIMPCAVPLQTVEYVDDNVLASRYFPNVYSLFHGDLPNKTIVLPPDTKIQAIKLHGTSNWTRTARIKTVQNNKPIDYFLKV